MTATGGVTTSGTTTAGGTTTLGGGTTTTATTTTTPTTTAVTSYNPTTAGGTTCCIRAGCTNVGTAPVGRKVVRVKVIKNGQPMFIYVPLNGGNLNFVPENDKTTTVSGAGKNQQNNIVGGNVTYKLIQKVNLDGQNNKDQR